MGCSLDGAADLYEHGRPANAEVLAVRARLEPAGIGSAELSLRVSPVDARAFETTRTVAIPGRLPSVGETVTVRFDPARREEFVLLEQSFEG